MCVFNDFLDFHIVLNRSIDLMHDFCSGLLYYTNSKVRTGLIYIDEIITLEKLNKRMQQFNFPKFEKNKPNLLLEKFQKRKKEIKLKIRYNLSNLQQKLYVSADIWV